jgi:ribosomal protein S18 acetylase RimI-like enzyme
MDHAVDDIVYARESDLSAQELADVFRRSGIRRPVDDLPRLRKMVESADLILTARARGRLVGVARSLTDFCYCCYLSDLAVDAEYQRRGIGKELIRLTREAIGEETMLLLLSAPGAMEYYPKVGLEKVENGWMIKRTR